MSIFANVYTGATANDGTGDALRTAFQKIDQNFANLAAVNNTANVVVYASGNANVFATYNPGVTSVAGRYGNVILGVNDVAGAVSYGTLNDAMVASNVYVAGVMDSFTTDAAQQIYNGVAENLSTTIANEAAIIAAGQATDLTAVQNGLNSANVHIQTIDANVGSLTHTVASILNKDVAIDANIGTLSINVHNLTSNAAVQENELNSLGEDVGSIQAQLTGLNANVGVISIDVNNLLANAHSQESELSFLSTLANSHSVSITGLTANAAVQENEIASLSARQTAANAAVAAAGYATVSQLTTNVNSLTSSINTTNNNVTAANARIRVLDANLGTATTNITALQSNAASQAVSINNINSSITSLTNTLASELTKTAIIDANLGIATTNISGLQSNAAVQAVQIYNLNAGMTASNARIQTIDANLGQMYTAFGAVNNNITAINVAIGITNATIASNVATLTANAATQSNQIVSTNANVTAANAQIAVVEYDLAQLIWAFNNDVNFFSANDAVQQVQINSISNLANATASSLATLTASVNPGNVTVTGNVKSSSVYSNHFNYSNGAPFLGGYGNTQVAQYLLTNTGNINAGYFTGNGYSLTGVMRSGAYGDANVQTFLSGNTFVGNVVIPGFVIASNISTSNAEAGQVLTNNLHVWNQANIGNLNVQGSLVVSNLPYTMGNSQNWNTAVTTVGQALDELAARLKAAGF